MFRALARDFGGLLAISLRPLESTPGADPNRRGLILVPGAGDRPGITVVSVGGDPAVMSTFGLNGQDIHALRGQILVGDMAEPFRQPIALDPAGASLRLFVQNREAGLA